MNDVIEHVECQDLVYIVRDRFRAISFHSSESEALASLTEGPFSSELWIQTRTRHQLSCD